MYIFEYLYIYLSIHIYVCIYLYIYTFIYIIIFIRICSLKFYIPNSYICRYIISKDHHRIPPKSFQPLRSKEPSLPNVMSLTVPPPVWKGEGGG